MDQFRQKAASLNIVCLKFHPQQGLHAHIFSYQHLQSKADSKLPIYLKLFKDFEDQKLANYFNHQLHLETY